MDSTWITLGILLVGVIVVIGGVLLLRLHAFLALILGALIVGALTPSRDVERFAVERDSFKIVARDRYTAFQDEHRRTVPFEQAEVLIAVPERRHLQAGATGYALPANAPLKEPASAPMVEVGKIVTGLTRDERRQKVAFAQVRTGSPSAELAPGDLFITLADRHAATSLAQENVGQRVAGGFGSTCASIGILIAMASIIGKCLLDSGAADRIVRSLLKLLGENGAPLSFLSSGFLLGIPVFFDTVFYLMIPLGKAMRMRTGRNYLVYVLTIVAGATMAHSLVPPTPGPLFVAEQLNVEIGVMILAGCIVGLFTAGFGYVYATVANRIWDLPLRESPEFSLEDLERISQRDESELPPFGLSLLPIVLPVILIGGNTALEPFAGALPENIVHLAATLGDKNIALVLAAGIALVMLAWQKRTSLNQLAGSVQAALASGGVIILITAGGGAFGRVLQQTGVAGLIRDLPQASPLMIITLAFLITTAIRTAQGSATVAMITAVGVLGGLSGSLGVHPVYLGLAIGCGSKPIAWMNDSGFWVIAKMSGMTETEALKYVTPMTTLMGLVGLAVILLGVTFFPLG